MKKTKAKPSYKKAKKMEKVKQVGTPTPSATPPSFFTDAWRFASPGGFPLDAPHEDARGFVQNITHLPVASTALIFSKAGTTRAKHFHKEDSHLCYVVSGEIRYYERRDFGAPIETKTFGPGQAFLTGPLVHHEMYFPVDTYFITLGNRSRTQEDYEQDLVRFPESLCDLALG